MRRDQHPALEDVLAHAGLVRSVARAVLGGDDQVEDVVQDTWLVAARQGPRRRGALRAWLAVVARNLAYRTRRGSKRREARERRAARPELVPDPAGIAEREETRRRLVAALLGLEEPYRSPLLLRYYEGLSVPEVALRLGVPMETARTRLRRGLERLRERLGEGRPGDRRALGVLLAPLAAAPRPSPWPAFVGGVAVKKALALATAVLLLAWVGWTVLGPWARREPPPPAGPPQAAAPEPRDASADLAAPTAPTVRAPDVRATPHATGRVVDGAGAPVAGARVLAWRDDVDAVVDPVAPAGGATSSSRTGASGTFTLPLEGHAPGFTLLATAPGFAPAAVHGVQAGDDVTIALPRSESIHGTVRDLDERPIARARVAWTGFVGGARFTAETTSGTDGTYRLEGLSRAGALLSLLGDSLDVSAEGYAPVRTPRARAGSLASGDRASDGVTWDVWLGRGATVRGRVVDVETGRPVPSARVVLWSEQEVANLPGADGNGILNPTYHAAVGDVLTSDTGAFAVDRVPAWGVHVPGVHIGSAAQRRLGRLGIVAEGYARETREIRVPTEGEIVEMEVRLTSGGSLRGRVLQADGRPAAGASVWWQHPAGPSSTWIPPVFPGLEAKPSLADAEGRYLLTGVPGPRERAETVHVSARAQGSSAWARPAHVAVTPRAGETVEAPDIVLGSGDPEGPSAILTVVDDAGRPVFGATFEGCVPGMRTDEAGRARLFFGADDPLPRSATVTVRAVGRDPVSSPGIPLAAGTVPEVRVTLGPRRRPAEVPVVDGSAATSERATRGGVAGTIRDARTGRPLLKWDLLLRSPGDDRLLRPRPVGPGRFRFEDVAAGTWFLDARAEGYEPELRKPVRVDPAEASEPIDVRLTPGLLVRGRVRDEAGAGIGELRLFFNGQGVPDAWGDTAPDGRYGVRGLRAGGRYSIWLAREDGRGGVAWWVPKPYEDLVVRGDATTVDHDFTVVPAGALSLTVRSEALVPRAALPTAEQRATGAATRLTFEDATRTTVWTTTGVWEGRRSAALPPGRWTVRVEVPGAPAVETDFTIEVGKSVQVTIDVP